MAAIWTPQSIEVYKSWVDAIMDEASDKLNSWETEFIESIGTQLLAQRNLSIKQANILERIYTEKTK